jgi:hypothetical protein
MVMHDKAVGVPALRRGARIYRLLRSIAGRDGMNDFHAAAKARDTI